MRKPASIHLTGVWATRAADWFSAPRRSRSFRGACGFTLIEMLAVIVLVSMVAGVTFSNLAAVGADSDRRSAIAQLQSLDSRTRLMSQQGQQVILTTTRDRDGVVLRAASTSEVIGTIALPPGVRVHLQVQDEPVGAIRFDRLGRSLDYTIILEHETANRVIDVAGLTGLIREGGPPT